MSKKIILLENQKASLINPTCNKKCVFDIQLEQLEDNNINILFNPTNIQCECFQIAYKNKTEIELEIECTNSQLPLINK